MRVSFLLLLAVLGLLAYVSVSVTAVSTEVDASSDIEWIQPTFIEQENPTKKVSPKSGGAKKTGVASSPITNHVAGGAAGGPKKTGVASSPITNHVTGGAPNAWRAVKDPKTGRTYWYDPATKKTSWTNPSGGKPPAAARPAAAKPAAAAATPVAAPAGAGGPRKAYPGGPLTGTPTNIVIPANILALGVQYTRAPKKGPVSNACPRSAPLMSDAVLTQILTAVWTAFGATAAQAKTYAASNLKQVHRESTGCPNVIQSIIDVNSKTDPAGGLVQFTQSTYNIWHVKGTVNSRFNPVSNLAAAVNAQVHGHRMTACHTRRLLNGCSGWSPDSDKTHNPYAN